MYLQKINKRYKMQYILILYIISSLTPQTNTPMQVQKQKQKEAFNLTLNEINNKKYLVPIFNLYGCQKYMLPKLNNAPVHHTFFDTKEIQTVYSEMNVDAKELNHNLDKGDIGKDGAKVDMARKKSQAINKDVSVDSVQDQSSIMSEESIKPKFQRPKLKQTGYTHFIHIPLWDALKDVYNEEIVPRIEEEDRDLLMPLTSMHMTILVFRLKKIEDLPLWSQVLKSAKKAKLSIKGVNIFPIKKNYAKVLFLNIKGAQDLIDRIVSKAIQLQLITQSELSHIKFDKVSGTYKAQPHISLLRTKGDDIFDFTEYIKTLNKVSAVKATSSEIRLSVIGSFDGKDYFNQDIVTL